jgi:DNA-binding transcriptional ArsR family regulator
MKGRHALANVAALVGDLSRASMLLALLDGRALPAGELARIASLSAAAASLHLGKLLDGGLLVVRQEGRHRYYSLASSDVAHALEALGVIATSPPPARPLSPDHLALRAARSCYDHLAGAVAVELAQFFERAKLLAADGDRHYQVTLAGKLWFANTLQIDVDTLLQRRRTIARRCLDWTERRPHVAGALGAALLERFIAMRWMVKASGSRAVTTTPRGQLELGRFFPLRAIPPAQVR